MMMTPNLDATGHQWVGALANYNFKVEYLKGWDNSHVDVLSRMTEQLGDDDMLSVYWMVSLLEPANHAELHNPLLQQAEMEDNIWINAAGLTNTNTRPKGEINVIDWAQAQ